MNQGKHQQGKYQQDIDRIVQEGGNLEIALYIAVHPDEKEQVGERLDVNVDDLPRFKRDYQAWYSEALTAITQLLPTRVDDFVDFMCVAFSNYLA